MIVMALDHVRDFMHRGAMSFSPTDLGKTTPILFLTRWITHFCLPVFVFTAGAGAFLWWRQRAHTKARFSRFLLTRGVWFVFLELTLMQFSYNFNFSTHNAVLLLVLWIFGICFIVMAALVWLPESWLLALGLAIVFLHNLLDRVQASRFGAFGWLWNILHQPGVLTPRGTPILITYTLLPWIGVLALGFCFGRILLLEPDARRSIMKKMGWPMVAAFFVLRAIDSYGDPAPWSAQKSPVFTALSFLNVTKYPASLDFLLITLGPALIVLAYLDRRPLKLSNPLIVFGRVPFFYFVLHLYLIHAVLAMLSLIRYGARALAFVFLPPPSMGGPQKLFPPDFGYSLPTVYLVWLVVIVCLYPLCRWYMGVRSRHRAWWLSYL